MANEFTFPTAQDMYDWTMGLPMFQQQTDLLKGFQSPDTFRAGVQPYIDQMMAQLGRSNLPSSSYADKMISGTLGSLWAQNQLNTLSGMQNLSNTALPYMQTYAAPYQFLLSQGLTMPGAASASPQTAAPTSPATQQAPAFGTQQGSQAWWMQSPQAPWRAGSPGFQAGSWKPWY